jgi:hypothetical protein
MGSEISFRKEQMEVGKLDKELRIEVAHAVILAILEAGGA